MTTSSKRQANTAYPAVSKDTLLSISKKTITPFPGLPSLLDVASEIFSKEPIKPENYQRFNAITDASDVFLTSYGANVRQQKPVQKKRYTIPKSPFSSSGIASNGNDKVWFYIDEEENTQGPFSSNDMDSWFDGGYFFNELLIRFKDQGEFRKLSEMLGKQQEYQQQQQQNYYNDNNANQRGGFGIARNKSGSNQQGNLESKEKFERRTEDKSAAQAQGGMFARAKKEEGLPLLLSPTEAPKQSSEEKKEVVEKPQEKAPEVKQEAPVVQKEEIPQAQPEKEVEVPAQEEVQEEEEQPEVEVKKPQGAPVEVDDSEWVSIKKTKNKKGKGGKEPVKAEPSKPVKVITPAQKPVEEKSPKKEEQAKVETPKPKEEEKTVEPKPVETQAKVEPPKLGVSYPFNQNIAPIVGGAKGKTKKTKIIANWLDEDTEVVAVQKELVRPTEDKLSSVVDFPSLGGSMVPEKKEPVNVKAGAKNKNTKEDQQLKQDLLAIQQQQQQEEEERKYQMRIKQEEERERKLKQQKEAELAEAKPVKKEAPTVTEDDFPSLGMGAKVQEKPAPKKKAQAQAAQPKKEEKPVAAPKQKASPVKASNNPKYTEDFPAL